MNERSENVALPTDSLYANCLKGYGRRAIKDRAPFVEWLNSLPADTEFDRDVHMCPLARFSGYSVGYCTYGGGDRHLPGWAESFVRKYIPIDSHPRLTIKRARAILRVTK